MHKKIILGFIVIALTFFVSNANAAGTPDLIVQDIAWTPTNPSIGDTVTFTATIMNQGNASSNGGYVHFYLDGSTTPSFVIG